MQGSEVELDDFVYEGPTLDPEDALLVQPKPGPLIFTYRVEVNKIKDASLDVKPLQKDPESLGELKKRVLTILHNCQVALDKRKNVPNHPFSIFCSLT